MSEPNEHPTVSGRRWWLVSLLAAGAAAGMMSLVMLAPDWKGTWILAVAAFGCFLLHFHHHRLHPLRRGNRPQVDSAADEIDRCREMAGEALVHDDINEARNRLETILRFLPGDLDAINQMGHVHELRGDLSAVESSCEEILFLCGDDDSWKAIAYGNLGLIYRLRGEMDKAEELHRKSLAIEEKLGRLEGMANQLGNLGLVYLTRGELDEAEALLRKSLALDEELGRKEGIANAYSNLGVICQMRGDVIAAREYWLKDRDLCARIGMPHRVEKVQKWLDELPPSDDNFSAEAS